MRNLTPLTYIMIILAATVSPSKEQEEHITRLQKLPDGFERV